MSSGLGETLNGLPPWAIPATAIVVVGLLLLRNNQSTVNSVRAWEPSPTDPGVVAMQNAEVSARTSAFESVIGMIGARDISQISATRDVTISQLQEEADIARTNAAVAIENYRTSVAQTLGLASTDAQLKLGMADAQVRSTLGAQALDVTKYGIDAQTQQAKISASVQKNQTNKGFWGGIFHDITGFAQSALPFLFA